MVVFTKPAGGEWGFKEGSIALEFTFEMKFRAEATVGYIATVGHYAIEGGGMTKLSLQAKVENNPVNNEKEVKLYFHFNGLKLYLQVKAVHREADKGNKKPNSEEAAQGTEENFTQVIKGGGDNALSPEAKLRKEYPIIESFTLPDDGLTVYTFDGGNSHD